MDLQASSSSAGRIVFSSVNRNLDIWSLTVDPRKGTALSELKQLTHGAAGDHSPSLSRDGKRMAFESDRTGKRVVWTMDLETGKERRLTDTPSPSNSPHISPDGIQVAYMVHSPGRPGALHVVPFSGGTPRKVTETASVQEIRDWMPDNHTILCQSYPPPINLAFVDVKTGGIRTLARPPNSEAWGNSGLSPDGRWFRFSAQGSLFIARLWETAAPPQNEWIPTRGGQWSSGGDRTWSVNGRDGFRCIWTQRLDPATKRLIGDEQPVYHFHGSRRSLTNVGFNPGLSVGPDKLVFTQGELTGNVWMAEWSKKP
jgi:Tol biopolymer transport system component